MDEPPKRETKIARVARMIAAGKSAKEVSRETGLKIRTVYVYAHRFSKRLPGSEMPMRRILLHYRER